MTVGDEQNFVDRAHTSQKTTSFETQQITSDYMALCGMKNLRIESEYALPPKVVVKRNLPMNNGLVSFS